MKRVITFLGATMALLHLAAPTSFGTPIVFDFANGGMRPGAGNAIVLTVGDLTATLTGFSVDKTGGVFTASEVTRWGTGAGNCNGSATEPVMSSNCSSPNHAVDNGGNDSRIDVLFVQFSSQVTENPVAVLLDSALISKWNSDFDASYWFGGTDLDGGPAIAGLTLAALGAPMNDDYTGPSSVSNGTTRLVDLGDVSASWLIFGAQVPTGGSSNGDKTNDAFKFKILTVEEQEVPAPGVLFLMSAGVLALVVTRRRKTEPTNPS